MFGLMKLSGVFVNRINSIQFLVAIFVFAIGMAEAAPSKSEVTDALKRASVFYSQNVARHGGYVYFYSLDLSRRLGEGEARATEIWVQPPGTPTVGLAFLEAYKATGDRVHLDAAIAAGEALMYGQLESGGWRNQIEFDPAGPRVDQYRNGKGKGKNQSTFDDQISQGALLFLVRLDEVLEQENATLHEAVEHGLSGVLDAQFSNGAFPQIWTGKVKAVQEKKASFPDYDWRTEGRIKEYWDQFTLNDGVAGSVTELLTAAHQVYGDSRYKEALKNLGHFLILAQMPEPQPAWAQQYDEAMRPIWARGFEPPAISGRESEDVMIALLRIAEHTGDQQFLEPIVSAVKYLESSKLPDGRMARYYELETNNPLYMERQGDVYSLTNDDSNLPKHYSWKNEPLLDLIKNAYRAVVGKKSLEPILDPVDNSDATVESILKNLDATGRWVSTYNGESLIGQAKFKPGDKYLSSEVFSDNVTALVRWLGR